MNEKKGKKISNNSLIIFLIILAIAAICLFVGIVLEFFNSKDSTKPDDNTVEVEEYKADVEEKLEYIISDFAYYNPGYEANGNSYYADKKTTKDDLSRTYILTQVLDKAFSSLNKEKATNKELQDVLGSSYDAKKEYEAYSLDGNIIKSRYKGIWNEDISETLRGQAHYYYSSKYNKYIVIDKKVESSSRSYFEYIYNSEESNDSYIFYIAIAIGKRTDNDTLVVYKDVDATEELNTYNDLTSFTLGEDNYNGFTKYKVTFTKINDDYYFDSVERIK